MISFLSVSHKALSHSRSTTRKNGLRPGLDIVTRDTGSRYTHFGSTQSSRGSCGPVLHCARVSQEKGRVWLIVVVIIMRRTSHEPVIRERRLPVAAVIPREYGYVTSIKEDYAFLQPFQSLEQLFFDRLEGILPQCYRFSICTNILNYVL